MSVRLKPLFSLLFACLLLSLPARAEEVTLPYKGLTLNANLEIADDKTFSDGVLLITHGTLAHNKMEIIATVQGLLKERGFNTLAINLSLAIDNRHGMYDCAVTHRHKHTNAVPEIATWVKWLHEQGAQKIVLVGHSRGGNQTAQYIVDKKVPKVLGAALLAPATWDKEAAANSYKNRYNVTLNSLMGKMNRAVLAKKGDEVFENVGFVYCPGASVTASSFVDYYAEDLFLDTPSVLVRAKYPVLVIAGSEDDVVKGLPEKMAGVVNDTIKLSIVDGADHFFLDFYAEDAADLIAEFAEELMQ